ncbi:MAG: Membrane associated serine protease, rhomboid family [Acidobacteria bacterium]|nr:Membrane associated serine protease, rhomboid family [Acidobacteriota bacterium]
MPVAFQPPFSYYSEVPYYYAGSPSAFFGGPVTRTVKTLIALNVAVFVLQVLARAGGIRFLELYFGLIPWRVTHDLMIWQFVSYMFLHDGFFHIFINMFTLYMFGNDLERTWGSRQFLRYYFITGIGAGLCSYLAGLNSLTVTIGASGAIYGLLLAYGLMYPNRLVYLYFLFPVRVKWLVLVMGVLAFLSSISGSQPGVANIAHLGGLLVGYVYLQGGSWLRRYQVYKNRRKHEELKRQFEVYYGDIRRKIDSDKKPTIH